MYKLRGGGGKTFGGGKVQAGKKAGRDLSKWARGENRKTFENGVEAVIFPGAR